MLVNFDKANPIEKARQRTDKVRMVLEAGKGVEGFAEGARVASDGKCLELVAPFCTRRA
jgi:hypothetical protein